MADDDKLEARRERLRKAREAHGTPKKPKGMRHADVEGDDPLGVGDDSDAYAGAAPGTLRERLGGGMGGGLGGGGLRGRLGQGGGPGRGGLGQLGGGQGGGGLRARLAQGGIGQGGGLGGGLRARLGQGGGLGQGGLGQGGGLRARLAQQGGGGMRAGDGDIASQRAFLEERLAKLEAKLAELDDDVEDATVLDEDPAPAKKG